MSSEHKTVTISEGHELPEGSIPIRALELVLFLNGDGKESVAMRYQGSPNIIADLGMVEYAKGLIISDYNSGD